MSQTNQIESRHAGTNPNPIMFYGHGQSSQQNQVFVDDFSGQNIGISKYIETEPVSPEIMSGPMDGMDEQRIGFNENIAEMDLQVHILNNDQFKPRTRHNRPKTGHQVFIEPVEKSQIMPVMGKSSSTKKYTVGQQKRPKSVKYGNVRKTHFAGSQQREGHSTQKETFSTSALERPILSAEKHKMIIEKLENVKKRYGSQLTQEDPQHDQEERRMTMHDALSKQVMKVKHKANSHFFPSGIISEQQSSKSGFPMAKTSMSAELTDFRGSVKTVQESGVLALNTNAWQHPRRQVNFLNSGEMNILNSTESPMGRSIQSHKLLSILKDQNRSVKRQYQNMMKSRNDLFPQGSENEFINEFTDPDLQRQRKGQARRRNKNSGQTTSSVGRPLNWKDLKKSLNNGAQIIVLQNPNHQDQLESQKDNLIQQTVKFRNIAANRAQSSHGRMVTDYQNLMSGNMNRWGSQNKLEQVTRADNQQEQNELERFYLQNQGSNQFNRISTDFDLSPKGKKSRRNLKFYNTQKTKSSKSGIKKIIKKKFIDIMENTDDIKQPVASKIKNLNTEAVTLDHKLIHEDQAIESNTNSNDDQRQSFQIPGFYSNHIQNLTINAPQGFDLMDFIEKSNMSTTQQQELFNKLNEVRDPEIRQEIEKALRETTIDSADKKPKKEQQKSKSSPKKPEKVKKTEDPKLKKTEEPKLKNSYSLPKRNKRVSQSSMSQSALGKPRATVGMLSSKDVKIESQKPQKVTFAINTNIPERQPIEEIRETNEDLDLSKQKEKETDEIKLTYGLEQEDLEMLEVLKSKLKQLRSKKDPIKSKPESRMEAARKSNTSNKSREKMTAVEMALAHFIQVKSPKSVAEQEPNPQTITFIEHPQDNDTYPTVIYKVEKLSQSDLGSEGHRLVQEMKSEAKGQSPIQYEKDNRKGMSEFKVSEAQGHTINLKSPDTQEEKEVVHELHMNIKSQIDSDHDSQEFSSSENLLETPAEMMVSGLGMDDVQNLKEMAEKKNLMEMAEKKKQLTRNQHKSFNNDVSISVRLLTKKRSQAERNQSSLIGPLRSQNSIQNQNSLKTEEINRLYLRNQRPQKRKSGAKKDSSVNFSHQDSTVGRQKKGQEIDRLIAEIEKSSKTKVVDESEDSLLQIPHFMRKSTKIPNKSAMKLVLAQVSQSHEKQFKSEIDKYIDEFQGVKEFLKKPKLPKVDEFNSMLDQDFKNVEFVGETKTQKLEPDFKMVHQSKSQDFIRQKTGIGMMMGDYYDKKRKKIANEFFHTQTGQLRNQGVDYLLLMYFKNCKREANGMKVKPMPVIKSVQEEKLLLRPYDINFNHCMTFLPMAAKSVDEIIEIEEMDKSQQQRKNDMILLSQMFPMVDRTILIDRMTIYIANNEICDNMQTVMMPFRAKFVVERHSQRMIQNKIDQEALENFTNIVDLVWKNNNMQTNFIRVTDSNKMDKDLNSNISMFDIKTWANVQNVYNEIDWEMIEKASKVFEQKKDTQKDDTIRHIMIKLNIRFKTSMKMYSHKRTGRKMVDPSRICMKMLQKRFDRAMRTLPVILTHKTAMCTRLLLKHCQIILFDQRFEHIVQGNTWNTLDQRLPISNYEVIKDHDFQGRPAPYRSIIKTNPVKELEGTFRIIFKENSDSIFLKLYCRDDDFQLQIKLDTVYNHAYKIFQKEHLKFKQKDKILTIEKVDHDRIVRSKSLQFQNLEGQYQLHHASGHQMLALKPDQKKGVESKVITEYHSDIETHKDPSGQIFRPYNRTNAEDKFNNKYMRYVLNQFVQPKNHKVKDSENIFFKKVETLLDKSDQDYNDLSGKIFGYKCQLNRDPDFPLVVMEVYIPSLVERAELKIKVYESHMRAIIKKDHQCVIKKAKNSMNKPSKAMKAIMVEDFHTDESMQHIDYEDLVSESSGSNDLGSSAKDESLMGNSANNSNQLSNAKQKRDQYSKNHLQTKKNRTFQQMIEIADKYNRQSSKRYYEQLTKLTAVKKKKQKNSSCFEVVEQEKLQEETEVMAFDTKKKNMRVDAFIAESLNQVNQDNVHQVKTFGEDIEYFKHVQRLSVDGRNISKVQKRIEVVKKIRKIMKENLQFKKFEEDEVESPWFTVDQQPKILSNKSLGSGPPSEVEMIKKELPEQIIKTPKEGLSNKIKPVNSSTVLAPRFNKSFSDMLGVPLTNPRKSILPEMINEVNTDGSLSATPASMQNRVMFKVGGFDSDVISTKSGQGKKPMKKVLRFVFDNERKPQEEKSEFSNSRKNKISEEGNSTSEEAKAAKQMKADEEVFPFSKVFKEDLAQHTRLLDMMKESKLAVESHIGKFSLIQEKSEESNLDLKNEIEIMNDLKDRRSAKAQQAKVRRHKREMIFQSMHQYRPDVLRKSVTFKDQQQVNFNIRLSKKLKGLQDLYGVEINLDVGQADRLVTQNSKSSLNVDLVTLSSYKGVQHDLMINKKMFNAVNQVQVGLVQDLLERYHVNHNSIRDENGNGLVTLAILQGSSELVKVLCAKGLNPNIQNQNGDTPLHYAVGIKNKKIIDLLLIYGGKENIENNQGKTCWELGLE